MRGPEWKGWRGGLTGDREHGASVESAKHRAGGVGENALGLLRHAALFDNWHHYGIQPSLECNLIHHPLRGVRAATTPTLLPGMCQNLQPPGTSILDDDSGLSTKMMARRRTKILCHGPEAAPEQIKAGPGREVGSGGFNRIDPSADDRNNFSA